MLTDFLRDHAFTIAWFGVMTFVWFGWGQEDPPQRWRWRFGVGSVLGLLFAAAFGYVVFTNWNGDTSLEGKYVWFGVIVALEVAVAAIGAVLLARQGQGRWMAWWVAFVVALHFIPLAWFLSDASLAVLGVVQAVGLSAVLPRLRASGGATSRLVAPVMGLTLLAFALISAVVFVQRYGALG